MSTISLIACVKSKRSTRSPAASLYTSPLFRKSLLYALGNSDSQFILSAKYGLLSLSDKIDPYEQTLNGASSAVRKAWGETVLTQLQKNLKKSDNILFLAGAEYKRPIETQLRLVGHKILDPFNGLSLGRRLASLRQKNDEDNLAKANRDFYKLMNKLFVAQLGGRRLGESSGKSGWPQRGVYIFLEPSEISNDAHVGKMKFRVTRVGTHAVSKESKTTLWDRISTHRGSEAGSGSHRSSIFRSHVGTAIAAKFPDNLVSSWGTGTTAPPEVRKGESALESAVSKYLGETRVLWLDVPDDASPASDRAYLERNAISVLSRWSILHPSISDDWLGTYSGNPNIALSGLWNLNYLFGRPHENFIDVLRVYVEAMLGELPPPPQSIAPKSWYTQTKLPDSKQFSFNLDDSAEAAPK